MINKKNAYEPLQGSDELLKQVRGLFLQRGESLSGWCKQNGIPLQNARSYLLGERNGRTARRWRQQIVDAANGTEEAQP